jgi:hypothetical protein
MTTPSAPKSNQTAGKDAKPCRWCQLWDAAVAASRLDAETFPQHYFWGAYGIDIDSFRTSAKEILDNMASLNMTDCPGCQRSAEIHQGDYLGPKQREWRAAMWAENPSMRFMMRACPGETFQEDAK